MKGAFLFVLFFFILLSSNSFADFTFVQTKETNNDTCGTREVNYHTDVTKIYITSDEA